MHPQLLEGAKIALAGFLGGIVGFERERKSKPAGLRTHILTSMAAALLTILSKKGFPGADPARLIAGMVAGMGFIGAGTIIKTESKVVGVTTAASILVATGIGIAVGSDFYILAIVSALLAYLVLELKSFERRICGK